MGGGADFSLGIEPCKYKPKNRTGISLSFFLGAFAFLDGFLSRFAYLTQHSPNKQKTLAVVVINETNTVMEILFDANWKGRSCQQSKGKVKKAKHTLEVKYQVSPGKRGSNAPPQVRSGGICSLAESAVFCSFLLYSMEP